MQAAGVAGHMGLPLWVGGEALRTLHPGVFLRNGSRWGEGQTRKQTQTPAVGFCVVHQGLLWHVLSMIVLLGNPGCEHCAQ